MAADGKHQVKAAIVERMGSGLLKLFPRKSSAGNHSNDGENGPADDAEEYYFASQWKLMVPRFKRHKVAVVSLWVLVVIYLVAIFAEFIAPYDPNQFNSRFVYSPPQRIRFVDQGRFQLRPFTYGYTTTRDPRTLELVFEENTSVVRPIRLFHRGTEYRFWGLWSAQVRLFGVDGEPFYLWGADRLGRDLFSRAVYGTRISVSIGLFGVALSLFLGVLLGGISGYLGGAVDMVIQRVIELIRSIPTIPLWMALSAALPTFWPPLRIYLAITIILSLVGWTALARVVRGRFISLREEQFVLAALPQSVHRRVLESA